MNEVIVDHEKIRILLAKLASAEAKDVTPQWIAALREEYPFFVLPEALLAKERQRSGLQPLSEAEWEQLRSAMQGMVSSPEAIERLTTAEGDRFDDFYPRDKKTITTESTIDKFLQTYGNSSEKETELLERLIFNPVPDYSQQLARQEEASLPDEPQGDSHDALVDRFIRKERGAAAAASYPKSPAQSDTPSDKTAPEKTPVARRKPQPKTPIRSTSAESHPGHTLSESLAKIYIKTHRYQQAYEILERLSLSYSNKNAYFADQLRFLRKLMLIEQLKKEAQQASDAQGSSNVNN